jgi:hypothetical protein
MEMVPCRRWRSCRTASPRWSAWRRPPAGSRCRWRLVVRCSWSRRRWRAWESRRGSVTAADLGRGVPRAGVEEEGVGWGTCSGGGPARWRTSPCPAATTWWMRRRWGREGEGEFEILGERPQQRDDLSGRASPPQPLDETGRNARGLSECPPVWNAFPIPPSALFHKFCMSRFIRLSPTMKYKHKNGLLRAM